MVFFRKWPCSEVLVAQTKTLEWKAAIRPSSLRDPCLPVAALPKRDRSESWPMKLDVEA